MNRSTIRLAERTFDFSRAIITYCSSENVTVINRSMLDQLIRSGTSIGANYAEANNAASRADFKNKIFTAKKEAAETKYWLSLLKDVTSNKEACISLTAECQYILMTLQKIINTMNQRKTANAR